LSILEYMCFVFIIKILRWYNFIELFNVDCFWILIFFILKLVFWRSIVEFQLFYFIFLKFLFVNFLEWSTSNFLLDFLKIIKIFFGWIRSLMLSIVNCQIFFVWLLWRFLDMILIQILIWVLFGNWNELITSMKSLLALSNG
jgi:hypothetical protein